MEAISAMRNSEDNNDDKDVNRGGLDRRRFGKLLVAGLGGLSVGRLAGAWPPGSFCTTEQKSLIDPTLYDPNPNTNTPFEGDHEVDVVVVGAGLSGLIAARELRKAGKTVCVLEALDRIGGRMYGRPTKEVKDGYVGYLDRGGQWVGRTQYHMQELVAKLNITPFDSYEQGRSIQSWNGKWSGFNGQLSDLLKGECKPPENLPPFNASVECRKGEPTLPPCRLDEGEMKIWQALLDISKQLKRESPWAIPPGANWDKITFEYWLEKEMGATGSDYRKWLPTMQSRTGGAGGFEPNEVSLLHMAWTQLVGAQSETPEQWLLLGGAGQIPKRLADDPLLKGCIVLKAPVLHIYWAERIHKYQQGGVQIIVPKSANGRQVAVTARAVIVAIPPSLRAMIEFDLQGHSLPSEYTQFMNGSRMGSMSKVHAVYDTAFWRGDCLSGSAVGNLGGSPGGYQGFPRVCEFIVDSSPPNGKPGILTSFITAKTNRELGDNEGKAKDLVLGDFVYFFGNQAKRENVKDFFYYNWDDKPWTCGAFTTHPAPGVWTSCGEVGWRKPVNDSIFWAGTETSDEWPGYFDGAVKAGKVAADGVLKIKW
jgi:monoamine oxidase